MPRTSRKRDHGAEHQPDRHFKFEMCRDVDPDAVRAEICKQADELRKLNLDSLAGCRASNNNRKGRNG